MTGGSIFVGRGKELADLDALRAAKLVTLWGPGGVGKTRLAREHARRERERGANVVWADLATARTAIDAAVALAAALGVSLEGRDEVTETIARAAGASGALVVADNVEQLDAPARDLVVAMARAEGARVLVTSQEALGAKEERTIPVGPLADPDALALFTRIAGTSAADEATREIVRRLDALPLAIELAAARVPLLGAGELLARLDRKLDVLGRTLRATIAWSWELLDAPEQTALAACATFEAPFDVALAESVMQLDDAAAALDALERLRARALLHAGAPDERGRPTLFLSPPSRRALGGGRGDTSRGSR